MIDAAGSPIRDHARDAQTVDFMVELESIRDPGSRSSFVMTLGDALGQAFGESNRTTPRQAAVMMLNAARRQVDGISVLAEIIHMYEGPSAKERFLILADAGSIAPVMRNEHCDEVRRLLEALPPLDERILWRAMDLEEDPRPIVVGGPMGIFDYLLSMNAGPDGLPPSLLFIEQVAARVDWKSAQALSAWNDARALEFNLAAQLAEIRSHVRRQAEAKPADPCVIVMFDPEPDDSGMIAVRHWVHRALGPWHPEPGPVRHAAETDLEDAVADIIQSAEACWETPETPLRIEFVLPYSLLNMDVAWFQTRRGTVQAKTLGLRYPVVVRSLERMQTRDIHPPWRQRWNALMNGGRLRCHWHVLTGSEANLELWHAQLASDRSLTSVVLAGPATTGPCLDALKVAMAEGVGLALWDRRESAPGDVVRQVIQALVTGSSVHELPHKVQRIRENASLELGTSREQHTGRHITLLWDDPNRLVDNERGHTPFVGGTA